MLRPRLAAADPVIAGAAISHEDLELDAADGTRFAAFVATPDGPVCDRDRDPPGRARPYRFYEELALRFAERGHRGVAIDYFGRTAGVAKRDDDFPYMEHTVQTTPDGIQADVGAAVAHLRGRGRGSIFTVGFCFGGRNSWLSAAGGHGLAGAVGFYGMPGERDGSPGPTRARRRAGRADPRAPGRRRRATSPPSTTPPSTQALTDAGVEHESSRTPARRTASSTGSTPTTQTPPRTPGSGRSTSSKRTRRRPPGRAAAQALNGFRIRTALAS